MQMTGKRTQSRYEVDACVNSSHFRCTQFESRFSFSFLMVLFNTFNHLLKYYVKILQNLLPRGLIVTTNLRGKGFDVGAI